MKLIIGIPLYNNIPIQSFLSIMKLVKNLQVSYDIIYTSNYPIDIARNVIVNKFLKKKGKYLLFLDSDNLFSPDVYERLLDLNSDIATGISFKKVYPYYPTIYRRDGDKFRPMVDYPKNKVIEVDACGMACCLIKREVFEKIELPYFESRMISDSDFMGEDFNFCKKAVFHGFSIKADTGLIVPHVGAIVDDRTYLSVRLALKMIKEGNSEFTEGMKREDILRMADIGEF